MRGRSSSRIQSLVQLNLYYAMILAIREVRVNSRVSHSSVCRYDSVKEGEEHRYARSWITGCQIIYSSRSNYIQSFKSLIFWTYSFSDLSSKKSGHAQGCQACSSVCLAPISLPRLHLDRCWFAAWSLTTLLYFKIIIYHYDVNIKHRKNCECCPGHYLILNHYSSMSWFKFCNMSVIVNCVPKSLIH